MAARKPSTQCPCGGISYTACCARFHQGEAAPDAERLMRSRYSAFVLKLEDYLLASWHPDTRPPTLDLAEDTTQWVGLQVRQSILHSAKTASVEFIARYKINGRAQRLHEVSQFVFENGRWFYLSAD